MDAAQSTALVNIVQALNIAASNSLMSREHASAIWKKYIKDEGIDIPKEVTKKDGITQKD